MADEQLLIDKKLLFQERLLDWYDVYHRKLPWRENPSLYKTVVSEFMLQQTQVDTVLPYFDRWLIRFPDFKTLAQAEEEEVVKYWEGLGYYSRARNLHKLAKQIAMLEEIPTDPKSWQQFPGIGPYTSAAITSISFGTAAAVVDGNVIRVLSRLTGNETLFKDNTSALKQMAPLAQALIHEENPGDYNQAMMELGATVCMRQKPLCTMCPVLAHCVAGRRGDAEQLPKFKPRQIEKVVIDRLWVVHKDAVLLHRIPAKAKRLASMYELPNAESLGVKVQGKEKVLQKKRGISNQQILETIYNCKRTTALEKKVKDLSDYHWVSVGELDTITLSGPHRKWVGSLLSVELN